MVEVNAVEVSVYCFGLLLSVLFFLVVLYFYAVLSNCQYKSIARMEIDRSHIFYRLSTFLWTTTWQIIRVKGAESYWFQNVGCKQEPLPSACPEHFPHMHTLTPIYGFVNTIKSHLQFFSLSYISTNSHTHACRSWNSCLSGWHGRPGCLLSRNPFCYWGVCWVYGWGVVLLGIWDCCIHVFLYLGVLKHWSNCQACVCVFLF